MKIFFVAVLGAISIVLFAQEVQDYPRPLETNLVFFQGDPKSLAPDELYFVPEIFEGDNRKFEMRTATGKVILDRVLCPRLIYGEGGWVKKIPVSYGFSPGKFNIDGDPIDMVVLGGQKKFEQMVLSNKREAVVVKVIGMMKMEECSELPCIIDEEWEQDWKVVGVVSHEFKFTDINQVPPAKIKSLNQFFSNYKGDRKVGEKYYPQTRVNGYLGKKETLEYLKDNFHMVSAKERQKEVEECEKIYEDRFEKGHLKNEKDSEFLRCMHRVSSKYQQADSKHLSVYLGYSAYQLLYKLKVKNPSYKTAIQQLEKLKQERKKHYRFVGFDLPYPGTGEPIFEWIKTKDRNIRCPKNTPVQHYERRPLIDLDRVVEDKS